MTSTLGISIVSVLIVSVLAIAGAVWAFWTLADAVDFRLRGVLALIGVVGCAVALYAA